MTEYEYYTGNPDTEKYVHANEWCELVGDVWGNMTENAAFNAINTTGDLDACPKCCDL